MADSVVVIAHAAQATGIGQFSFRGKTADPFAEPELLTVAAAHSTALPASICLATIADGEGDRAALAAAAEAQGADHQMTTPGRTFSARYWSSMSSQIWGRGV